MIHQHLHQQILKHYEQIEKWFISYRKEQAFPIYTSVDIRDSGFKVAVVDANIYPAGFNNICYLDQEHAPQLMKDYLDQHYGEDFLQIGLLTEEHTNNPYYWENVRTLKEVIEKAGRVVHLAFPRPLTEPLEIISSAGHKMFVQGLILENGNAKIGKDFYPDLLVSNNDFSVSYEEFLKDLKTPLNPPRELGWYQRKKSLHFSFYNKLAQEFAEIIQVDPWMLTVETELFSNFDLSDEVSIQKLAVQVDQMLARIKNQYLQKNISQEPFVFIKNNAGTYGLGVTKVSSGQDVLAWNYKARKKMKAAKGGREIEEVILQEGIPSIVKEDKVTAEPAVYLIGCELAGGFLRTHQDKGPFDSLNSPGAVYKKLCTSDLQINVEGKPLENVYGWVARLSSLAIGLEGTAMKVKYKSFKHFDCSSN